jgi:hypothetical protein
LKPLAIDLFCGLGGWAEGLLSEGYDVVGFDIERHAYGAHRYPTQLVLQDVLTLHGSQFEDAALIVASPPCQEYSYMAMPWSRGRAKAAAIRADETGQALADLNRLFDACFRIQAQASMAAGRHVPMVVENVRGAQPWVGRARWNFGSFYLWGDVPALMPFTACGAKLPGAWIGRRGGYKHLTNPAEHEGAKVPGFRFDGSGRPFQSASVEGVKTPGICLSDVGFNVANAYRFGNIVAGVKIERSERDRHDHVGVLRKFGSAMIAKIPEPLARHIARTYRHRNRLTYAGKL